MDNKSIYTFLIELFLSNKKTKKEELKTINNFKYIYNLTKEYQYLQKKLSMIKI